MCVREAADYDASIAGWDFWSYIECYGSTQAGELRNKICGLDPSYWTRSGSTVVTEV